MKKLNIWSNSIKLNIENQKDELFKRDYKFFKIDRLERIAERIDQFSDSCETCKAYMPEIENLSLDAAALINGSPRDRSMFEKRNEIIVKHLKDEHGLIQKDYYASVYSFAGFAAGLLVFGAVTMILDIRFFIFGLLSGFTIGLITGRIVGRNKDKQKEKDGLIL